MKQDWLVEERLPVVIGRPPVARFEQFTGRFGVMRLVRIPEGGGAESPEDDDEEDDGQGGGFLQQVA
jgi:hypothetical protein